MNELHFLNKNLTFRLAKKNNEYLIQYRFHKYQYKNKYPWYKFWKIEYECVDATYSEWFNMPTAIIEENNNG